MKRTLCLLLTFLFTLTARAQPAGPRSAVTLDGTTGYAQVPNGVWFNGDFTVEGWVFVRSYNYWSRLFDFGNGPDTDNVYLALTTGISGYPAMGVFTNYGAPVLHAGSPLPLGQWAHLAATLSGTTGTIYINGVNVGSGTMNLPPNVIRTNNYIGRSDYATDGHSNASFDEVRIWNVARTQAQIQASMHRTLVGNETGLVSYWRMDESSGTMLVDSTGQGQNATLFGGSTRTSSTAPIIAGGGSALSLNAASGQYVNIPHQAALDTYPLTVMAWFQAPSGGGSGALVNKYVSSSLNGYQMFISGGRLQGWYIRDSGNNVFSGGPMDAGVVNDGLWHHAAMAIDAAGGRLYLDGVLKRTLPWTGTPGPVSNTQFLSLGLYPGDSFFTGQLDDVSVWYTALTTSQIQSAMKRPLVGNETGLLGYWPMNEAAGTNIYDMSGHSYTGALAGNPARTVSGANFVLPDPGYGINLTGTNNEYVQLPNGVWFSNDFTVEGWVYCRGYNNWSRLFDFGNAGYLQEVYMALSGGTGGFPTMGVFTNGNNNLVSSSQQLPLNQWTHLATTLSGSTATIYMNGTNVGSGQVLVPGNFVRTNNYIGRSLFAGDAYANASFDEVRIWNVARSPAQIQQSMNRPLTGAEAGLLAYYRMDEGMGTNAVDGTGNGSTATLVNGPVWCMANEPLVMPAFSLGTIALLEGPGAGIDSVALVTTPTGANWSATVNASWLHLSAANQYGTGSTNVIFTYDANPGATRTGNLTIAGQILTVTQAGAAYVAAQPITTLVYPGLDAPYGVAVDFQGNVYLSDSFHNSVKKWNPVSNTVVTLASSGLNYPAGLAVDAAGNVYIADYQNSAIKEWIAANNTVATLVSTGLSLPFGVAVDGSGNVYIADSGNNAIKKWSVSDGSVTPLVSSGLNNPSGVAVDDAGNVYIADTGNQVIKKWSAANSNVTTVVLLGVNYPYGVAVDGSGNLYIADTFHFSVKKWVAASGVLVTLVPFGIHEPTGVAVDTAGNVYFTDYQNSEIMELPYAFVDPTGKSENLIAGIDALPSVLPAGENLLGPFAPASDQSWLSITGVSNGVVSFSFSTNIGPTRVANITLLGQTIPVTQSGAAISLGTTALLEGPGAGNDSVVLGVMPAFGTWTATANDSWLHLSLANQSGAGSTNLIFTYDANPGGTRIGTLTIAGQTLTVTQAGSTYVPAQAPVTTLAASGLSEPFGVAVDSAGDVYIADYSNNAIKKWIASNNTVTNLPIPGLSGPVGVALDNAGNLYIADFGNNAIKKWTPATGSISNLVATGLSGPQGVAVDGAGNVYIADTYNHSVKEWMSADGSVTNFLPSDVNYPYDVAVDAAGNVYIADTYDNTIKKWIAASGSVTNLVSSGLNDPSGVAVDGSGNVYIVDRFNNTIRKWSATTASVSTLVASGMNSPFGAAVDATGNIYIADAFNNAVKELPRAFVDPSPKSESGAAGSDNLPMVLPITENLFPPFAPVSDQPWLTIVDVSDGVVDFSFTATTSYRTANITVLGQSIPIIQQGSVAPPRLIGATLLSNGAFQFSFTNNNPGQSFTILSSTNLSLPLSQWTAAGVPTNIAPGVFQFTSGTATGGPRRFFSVRSP